MSRSFIIMARTRPEDRLAKLVEAAARVFLAKGYRRTQIADVARALQVAPGTVYLYVESKEALFDLVVRVSLSPALLEGLAVPVPTPAAGATLSFIREALEREARVGALEKALKRKASGGRQELEAIARELYGKAAGHWRAVKIMERSALDWPELAALWFEGHRSRLIGQLTRYFEIGMETEALRRAPDAQGAARLVLETVAYFAMHRRLDPEPTGMGERTAEETVVDAIVHAYAGRRSSRPGRTRSPSRRGAK